MFQLLLPFTYRGIFFQCRNLSRMLSAERPYACLSSCKQPLDWSLQFNCNLELAYEYYRRRNFIAFVHVYIISLISKQVDFVRIINLYCVFFCESLCFILRVIRLMHKCRLSLQTSRSPTWFHLFNHFVLISASLVSMNTCRRTVRFIQTPALTL